jgi:predicted DNA-binding protein with PD1-like motif
MQAAQGSMGRVFVLRLEDGDRIPDCIETFAAEQKIMGGMCVLLGGAGTGKLVAGPENGDATPIVPMLRALSGVHEVAAVGTLFADEEGVPRLHMHGAFGRDDQTLTGCVRQGVHVWKIAECVILEIVDSGMLRRVEPSFGFAVLGKGEDA